MPVNRIGKSAQPSSGQCRWRRTSSKIHDFEREPQKNIVQDHPTCLENHSCIYYIWYILLEWLEFMVDFGILGFTHLGFATGIWEEGISAWPLVASVWLKLINVFFFGGGELIMQFTHVYTSKNKRCWCMELGCQHTFAPSLSGVGMSLPKPEKYVQISSEVSYCRHSML